MMELVKKGTYTNATIGTIKYGGFIEILEEVLLLL